METIELNTTQNVSLEFPVASIADRILAYLVDMLVIGTYALAIGLGLLNWLDLPMAGWMLLLFIPVLCYHLIFEMFFNGQSPGKRLLNIKIFKSDGRHLSAGSCFIRWIFRLADITFTSGALAIIMIIVNGKGQRLGDIAAGTTVLKIKNKNHIHQTLWMEVEENYQPRFPEAERLSDQDVQTIKEVLQTTADVNNRPDRYEELLSKARQAIERKTHTQSELSDREYLTTMIKDYNAFHQADHENKN
ncbi:MAG: RDD family protein [Marinilabiliaceae bacterium]